MPAVCQQLAEQELTDKTLTHWQAAILECQHQPQWLARLGNYLNQRGQYREAAEHLERALMLDPLQIDAQIDYAIAMAGLGDKISAVALIQDLLQNPQLPPALQPVLTQQQAQLSKERRAPSTRTPWQTQIQLSAVLGRDSNLLGAPNIDSLALTLGGITQTLPLEASYLAQAGNYHRTEAVFHARRQENHGPQWDLLASTRQRDSHTLAQVESNQYELIAERSTTHQVPGQKMLPGNYLRLSMAELKTRQSGRYQVQGLAFGWGQALQADSNLNRCVWRAGIEVQSREYASNSSLSGQYRGLSLLGSCQRPLSTTGPQQSTQWHLSIRSGKDHPRDAARAGGAQTQTAIQMHLQVPAQRLWQSAQGQWGLSGEWAKSQDTQTYSPLLNSGEVRKINKYSAKLEYLRNLSETTQSARWQAHAGLEWTVHKSNIRLFGLRSWGPYAGLRFVW